MTAAMTHARIGGDNVNGDLEVAMICLDNVEYSLFTDYSSA